MIPDKITNKKKETKRKKEKEMKLETAIWNSKKTKVLAVITFDSTKELQDFMKELQVVEKEASYSLLAVKKG